MTTSEDLNASMFHKDPSSRHRQSDERSRQQVEASPGKGDGINQDMLRALEAVAERCKLFRSDFAKVPKCLDPAIEGYFTTKQ